MFKRKVLLPTTLAEFDELVSRVVKKYKLHDTNHAAAVISVAIRHLPNEEAYTTLNYLGQCVLKNIANYVANHKSETMKHASQVEHLASILLTDPNNQQALDELQKAADQGSTLAKDALSKMSVAEKVEEPAVAGG